jgi:GT2 family glycosyltransferase
MGGMSEAKVSVIVPTYNRAHCVTKALDSALGQTHGNVEVIVIDDGSTDNTRELISNWYDQEPRVKYFRQDNAGVTAARNRGLSRAAGDFVALLDSDDCWKPWKLEVQLACMEKHPELGMVWTDMEAVDPAGKVTFTKYLHKMYGCYGRFTYDEIFSKHYPLSDFMGELPEAARGGTLHTGQIFSKMFLGSLVHTSTVLLRRSRFEQVKGFNEELKRSGEDYDFHLRTCREGPVGLIDVSSIQYQVGMPDRLTDRKFRVIAVGNVLKTIVRAYEQDRAQLDLPSGDIRGRFADVHAWLGEALLESGDTRGARKHLFKSMRLNFMQKECAKALLMACLPPRLLGSFRAYYRRMKKWRESTQEPHGRPT